MTKAYLTVLLLALVALFNGCSWFRGGHKAPPPPPSRSAKKAPSGPAARNKRSSGRQTTSAAPKQQQPALNRPPAEASKTPARAPVLGEVITDEQKAEYRRQYETNSNAAREILSSFAYRTLTREQADTVARVRSFLQQATAATGNDWSLAASLARRAALLARDLSGRLQ